MTNKNNSGYFNSGYYNSGDYNSGYYNSGNRNSGYYNSGDYNSGSYNSGHRNSGYRNSGYRNSGDFNSGYYNSGSYNSGYLNSNNPNVRLFNKDSGFSFNSDEIMKLRGILYKSKKSVLTWITELKMSEQEKSDNPSYKTTGGYLKRSKNRCTELDESKLTNEDKEFIKSLPNFDNEIFKDITGIDLENNKKKIIIAGKEIEISNESFEELKKQLLE